MNGLIKRIIKFLIVKYKYRKSCLFDYSSEISLDSSFEGCNKIGKCSKFNGSMGFGSYMNYNCNIEANIGRFTSIAPYVKTNSGVHPIHEPYATTSPMFFSVRNQCGKTFADKTYFAEIKKNVIIGNDCWIGQGAFLSGGIVVGDGAVILAGAVVVKDVAPYTIVGGVPAKVIDQRFDSETIQFLLKIKWWNKDYEWFKKNWRLLNDIDKLKEYSKFEK